MRAIIVNPASASGRTATRWRPIVASLEALGGVDINDYISTGNNRDVATDTHMVAGYWDVMDAWLRERGFAH